MNELTLTVANTTNLLTTSGENEIKQIARKLMKLTSGGNKLTADQATDLAVYSWVTQLNPFNGECYFLDRVGPVPGIAGYRIKAQNYVMATSDQRVPVRIWEEYRPATTEEANFDPEKDIAWVCVLRDSVSQERWEQRIIQLGTAYKQMGANFKEAHDQALADAGPCPSWEAVGVVKASENFGPDKWDRNERAKKRAAKGCYRKAFPSMAVPDAEFGEAIDLVAEDVKQDIVMDVEAASNEAEQAEAELKRTEDDNLSQLGF